jgi:alpha-amylase/alpha-mannosidase (GH57 family)
MPVSPQSGSSTRFVCVHGHFYQPPRENPWLETVEVQESAAPYHDWNERITSECYAPNGDADQASAERYGGHGSALAQVYNHIIMPLASERDARTQIRWGIVDFEHRFGRKPEGMWLAETAVSRSVLDLMAQAGIRFTILAPHQCARVRPLAAAASTASTENSNMKSGGDPQDAVRWSDTHDASVDPTHPYLVQLDEGRSITVFFYDGPASRAIAFEGVLNDGEQFARRLLNGLHADSGAPQLAHVATDGESYGHHHKHGEMALSYALHWIDENKLAQLTNYGEFLERFPPQWEAEVADNTSWSCAHGVERWRSDCGCNGGHAGWNQQWRGPLRDALDMLRDRTAPLAEAVAAPLLHDLWAARDAYIHVVLDRSADNVERFLAAHAVRNLSADERVTLFELLELERHTQLMYTSCGWFFDEISGIETVQIIAYAGRVLQLAAQLFGEPGVALEAEFLRMLALAQSNVAEIGNGAQVYRRFITGGRLDLENVGAHYAISSMFRSYPESGQLFCFDARRESFDVLTSGRGRFAVGRAALKSRITEETEEICFAVLHLGDQNLSAAVKRYRLEDEAAWQSFVDQARGSIRRANLPELIREIDNYFGGTVYSLTSLFSDEQHRILTGILNQTLSEVEGSLMRIYEEHATLLDFLGEANVTAPPALAVTASFAINASLRRALEADTYETAEIARLLRRAEIDHVQLDAPLLGFTADKRMKRAMVRLEAAVEQQNLGVLHETLDIAESVRTLPIDVNLWQAQNIWNDLLRRSDSTYWSREWREGFRRIGLALNIAVDDLVVERGVRAF